MPALVAGIHVFTNAEKKAWMAGTSPAMTIKRRIIAPAYNPNP
jgi:hypothetical protein